jgi:hypothetical protein
MEETAVAAEIKWEWMANDTKRKTWLQNVPWSWISWHTENVGIEFVHRMGRMYCFMFREQWRKTKAVDTKEKFDHKNSATLSHVSQ